MATLVFFSHLPADDLKRVVEYVFDHGREVALPVGEIERAIHHLLTLGVQNRWDVNTICCIAREVLHGLALVDQPRYNADTVNKIHEIARNSVLDLALANHHEAHDELEALEAVHFVALEYVVIDPPPQHAPGPAIPGNVDSTPNSPHDPLQVIEGPVGRTLYSFKRNGTRLQVEFMVSFALMDSIAYGAFFCALLAVVQGFIYADFRVWTYNVPFGSLINNIPLQDLDRVMIGWVLFSVGLSGAGFFAVIPAFVRALNIIVGALLLAWAVYIVMKEARTVGCIHGMGF